jgi:hypothetical protein
MKKINCNGWAPRNIKWAQSGWGASVPTAVPPIADNKLFYNFYLYHDGGPARFYYRLAYMLYNILDEGGYFDVLYNILDEGGYFDEDD